MTTRAIEHGMEVSERLQRLREEAQEVILREYAAKAAGVAARMAHLAEHAKSETNQVLAGREVLNAMLPQRGGGPIVQINNAPRLISHLGIPEVSVINGRLVKEIEATAQRDVATEGISDAPLPKPKRWTGKKSKKLKRKRNPLKDPRPDLSAAGLTANQARVIEMNSAGMSMGQVARELGKGRSTVFSAKQYGVKKLERIVHAAQQQRAQFGTKPVEPVIVPLPPNRQLPAAPAIEQPAMPPPVMAYRDEP